jgi:hypothetical protein
VLGPHDRTSETHAVVGIHHTLACEIADLLTQGASSFGIFIGRVLPKAKFRQRFDRLPRYLLVLRKFWLPTDAAIREIIGSRLA